MNNWKLYFLQKKLKSLKKKIWIINIFFFISTKNSNSIEKYYLKNKKYTKLHSFNKKRKPFIKKSDRRIKNYTNFSNKF